MSVTFFAAIDTLLVLGDRIFFVFFDLSNALILFFGLLCKRLDHRAVGLL